MQTNIHGGAEEMRSAELIWNAIHIELIDSGIVYDFKSKRQRVVITFHVLPVGKIKTIPIGFKSNNFLATVVDFVADVFYDKRRRG